MQRFPHPLFRDLLSIWTFIPLHSSIKSSPMPIKPEERFDLFWGWKRCQASFYCCFSHGQQRRHFASLLQVFKWRWVQKSIAKVSAWPGAGAAPPDGNAPRHFPFFQSIISIVILILITFIIIMSLKCHHCHLWANIYGLHNMWSIIDYGIINT